RAAAQPRCGEGGIRPRPDRTRRHLGKRVGALETLANDVTEILDEIAVGFTKRVQVFARELVPRVSYRGFADVLAATLRTLAHAVSLAIVDSGDHSVVGDRC